MSILTLCPFKTPMDRIWSRLAKKFFDLRSSKISSRNSSPVSSCFHLGELVGKNFHPFENVMPVKLGVPLLKDRGENKQMFETTTYLDTLGVFSYWASGSESKSNSEKQQNCDVSKVSPWFFDSFCWGTRICKPEKKWMAELAFHQHPFA